MIVEADPCKTSAVEDNVIAERKEDKKLIGRIPMGKRY